MVPLRFALLVNVQVGHDSVTAQSVPFIVDRAAPLHVGKVFGGCLTAPPPLSRTCVQRAIKYQPIAINEIS